MADFIRNESLRQIANLRQMPTLIAGLVLLGLLGRWRSKSRLSPVLPHLERD
jgi:hypothetical protein